MDKLAVMSNVCLCPAYARYRLRLAAHLVASVFQTLMMIKGNNWTLKDKLGVLLIVLVLVVYAKRKFCLKIQPPWLPKMYGNHCKMF